MAELTRSPNVPPYQLHLPLLTSPELCYSNATPPASSLHSLLRMSIVPSDAVRFRRQATSSCMPCIVQSFYSSITFAALVLHLKLKATPEYFPTISGSKPFHPYVHSHYIMERKSSNDLLRRLGRSGALPPRLFMASTESRSSGVVHKTHTIPI